MADGMTTIHKMPSRTTIVNERFDLRDIDPISAPSTSNIRPLRSADPGRVRGGIYPDAERPPTLRAPRP